MVGSNVRLYWYKDFPDPCISVDIPLQKQRHVRIDNDDPRYERLAAVLAFMSATMHKGQLSGNEYYTLYELTREEYDALAC